MSTTVEIRELKARLDRYIQKVKKGESVIITERGTPVGKIVPTGNDLEKRLGQSTETGLVLWNGQKLPRVAAFSANLEGNMTVSELLIEARK